MMDITWERSAAIGNFESKLATSGKSPCCARIRAAFFSRTGSEELGIGSFSLTFERYACPLFEP